MNFLRVAINVQKHIKIVHIMRIVSFNMWNNVYFEKKPKQELFDGRTLEHSHHITPNMSTYRNKANVQYIPRNMHTVFALLCFVVVIHWLIFPYPSCLLHWHCGNVTIAPVPAKRPWWIWRNTSCEFIMNDYITTTKQSTTKPCAYFLGYTVYGVRTYFVMFTRLRTIATLSAPTVCGPFYLRGLTLIPAWISNHMPSKVWDEITYPFLNFNGCTVEV